MVCTTSFDGHVSVFSLMGGSASGQDIQQQKVSAIKLESVTSQVTISLSHSHITLTLQPLKRLASNFFLQYHPESHVKVMRIKEMIMN